MKATFKSMMVIGMMILGTVTSFASNNIDKHHDPSNRVKAECHINHIHDKHCGGHVIADHPKARPEMDKKMHKHMKKGKHRFDKHGHCKKCHLTKHEIDRIMHDRHNGHHHDAHHPVPPKPFKHHKHHNR